MKLLSGTRNRTATYVVEPSRQVTDLSTGRSVVTPPLRVKFKEHMWNSESEEMKRQYKEFVRAGSKKPNGKAWKEEEVQQMVERYMLDHRDFGRADGRGIFLDTTDTLQNVELRRQANRRCIFKQDVGEESIDCEAFVEDPDSDFCEAHKEVVAKALARASVGAEE